MAEVVATSRATSTTRFRSEAFRILETKPPSAARTARIYCLVARNARKAVVFRRGPSKQVCLLAWDLKTDRLELGQWFKGRIYERRCDLSPDGSLLVYFAAKYRGPVTSWTAVSRPPLLTALAFFPKGDCWGGGGLFDDARTLSLNHPVPEKDSRLGDDTPGKHGKKHKRLPRYMREEKPRPWERNNPSPVDQLTAPRNPLGLDIQGLGQFSGAGEDDPIMSTRLLRDGWVLSDTSSRTIREREESTEAAWLTFEPVIQRRKPIPNSKLSLQVSLHGIQEKDGRWYIETMEIVDNDGTKLSLGRVDWADVDHNGDVLYAAGGKLFRAKVRKAKDGIKSDPKLLADLNGMRFEDVSASDASRA